MTDAAHTSGLPNAPTGENCLLAVVRWLVVLYTLHSLIACGRKLAGALFKPSGPDDSFLVAIFGTTDRARIFARLTGAVRRAGELQSMLLAHRPTEHGFPLEVRRAITAQLLAICQDLGILPRGAARRCTPVSHHTVGAGLRPASTKRTCMQPIIATTATGPPAQIRRGDAEAAEMKSATRVYPWSFSGRMPSDLIRGYTRV